MSLLKLPAALTIQNYDRKVCMIYEIVFRSSVRGFDLVPKQLGI